MACTYILYSQQLDRYYIGHTEEGVEDRVQKQLKVNSGFTADAKDWKLVFERYFDSRTEAFDFENLIKKWKSRRAIENLVLGS